MKASRKITSKDRGKGGPMAKIKLLALLSYGDRFRRVSMIPLLALFWNVKEAAPRMKLISWQEIWTPLSEAKRQGNLGIAQVFLETLFEQAVFDDRGAWSRMK
jgi:hypothetical protein